MENKNLITVITNKREKVNVIDSREVAEMMGRTHTDIMKMIQGSGKNLGIIPTLTKGNFHVVNYFIESIYKLIHYLYILFHVKRLHIITTVRTVRTVRK